MLDAMRGVVLEKILKSFNVHTTRYTFVDYRAGGVKYGNIHIHTYRYTIYILIFHSSKLYMYIYISIYIYMLHACYLVISHFS